MRLWYRWHLGDICGKKKIERDEQREGDGERQREQDGKRQSEIERERVYLKETASKRWRREKKVKIGMNGTRFYFTYFYP